MCLNLKIKELRLKTNSSIRIVTDIDYDIYFSVSNSTITNGTIINKYNSYDILLNGKFNRNNIKGRFLSKEWIESVDNERGNPSYINSFNKLKEYLKLDLEKGEYYYEDYVEFKCDNNKIYSATPHLQDFLKSDNFKFYFDREGHFINGENLISLNNWTIK